jgi:hypothetical protein
MARPKKIDRPVEKRVMLAESLVARVELELYSDLEGKVPFAAWQKFLTELIEERLAKLAAARNKSKFN